MVSSQITPSEYNPYYQGYIDLVKPLSLHEALTVGLKEIQSFFEIIPEDKLNFRYSEGKWTPKDILQHVTDTERVFAYRALYFARSSNANLIGFDESTFVNNAQAENKSLTELLDENIAVRAATISLFKSLNQVQLKNVGVASGSEMSVRAAGFIICGHSIHHCNIIKERYL
ncbi:MAG: DinB family protein [Aequorivita sp.]